MILAILQARLSSTRLPCKVLKQILGKPMLALQIERVRRAGMFDKLVVATSTEKEDDAIQSLCTEVGALCFRGSLNDVLDRFYQAALPHCPEHIVRLTGDCPLADPAIIDATIEFYLDGDFDYVSNAMPSAETFPDGLDVEIFKFSALEAAWREAVLPSHREHLTQFIVNNPERFKLGHYKNNRDLSHLRWTVDEPDDFELIMRIYKELYSANPAFTMNDILALLERKPELQEINRHIARNEGLKKALQKDSQTFKDK